MFTPNTHDDPSSLFRVNVSYKLAVMFLGLFVFMTMMANPSKKDTPETPLQALTTPGNLIIEMYYNVFDPTTTDLVDDDFDLWAGPLDSPQANCKDPVGYSNKASECLNYVRDDLGCVRNDAHKCILKRDAANYEMIVSRGIQAGTHCVNVQWYRKGSSLKEVPVKVIVRIQKAPVGSTKDSTEKPKVIVDTEVLFRWEGQEENIQCFTLNDSGDVIEQYQSNAVCLRLRYNAALGRCTA